MQTVSQEREGEQEDGRQDDGEAVEHDLLGLGRLDRLAAVRGHLGVELGLHRPQGRTGDVVRAELLRGSVQGAADRRDVGLVELGQL